MLKIQFTQPSPEQSAQPTPTLADLSRNASVISSGSSSSSASSLVLKTPPRPRPVRTFSSPRSRSPHSPATPRPRPLPYLAKELVPEDPSDSLYDLKPTTSSRVQSRAQSKAGSRNSSVNGRFTADDFQLGDTLGEGSYSSVMHGTHRATGKEYAIKILEKGHLARYDKLQTALAEKNTLVRLGAGHPGIVKLHWAFHDDYRLYFVLDLARNGEMQSHISRMGSLSLDCARYYTAQIVDAVEYMHLKGVIHRDLKPENLLLDDDFRIKITDFGTGKILESGVQRAKTWVGTAQYVSPELLENSETSTSSDLWAVGCILYQMIAGRFAFQGLSDYLTWQKVKALEYTFPEGFDSKAKDLVQKLLIRNPLERLGAGQPGSSNDMAALKSHPFFESIDWSTLWTISAPPLEPGLVKRERNLPGVSATEGHNWDDVGYDWEDMVGIPRGSDGIPWARDDDDNDEQEEEERTEHGLDSASFAPSELLSTQQGHDAASDDDDEHTDEVVTSVDPPAVNGISSSKPMDMPAATQPCAGSTTSSSEGSPIEKLGAALEAALNRGRNRIQTPIQGNGVLSPDWSSILLPGEEIIFHSPVATASLKRRPSKLLSIASVTPKKKQKNRELILTTHRVVCIKAEKGGRGFSVKMDLGSQRLAEKEKGEKEKEREKERDKKKVKDSANNIISIEPKGEREFVILTTSKSHSFAVDSMELASSWVNHIRIVVDSAAAAVAPTYR